MASLRDLPRLDRDQEHELAVEYLATHDAKIAKQLVTSNLKLVVKLAHEYTRAGKNLLDLIQEGNVGLVQAVEKYDPHRGVKLSSYAAWWIRAFILRAILHNARMVRLGTTATQRKLFFNLRKEKAKLERMGFVPTADRVAKAMQVPESEVLDMEQRLGAPDASLDAPVDRDDGDGGRSRLDLIESIGRAARHGDRGGRVPRAAARGARGVRRSAQGSRASALRAAPDDRSSRARCRSSATRSASAASARVSSRCA